MSCVIRSDQKPTVGSCNFRGCDRDREGTQPFFFFFFKIEPSPNQLLTAYWRIRTKAADSTSEDPDRAPSDFCVFPIGARLKQQTAELDISHLALSSSGPTFFFVRPFLWFPETPGLMDLGQGQMRIRKQERVANNIS